MKTEWLVLGSGSKDTSDSSKKSHMRIHNSLLRNYDLQ